MDEYWKRWHSIEAARTSELEAELRQLIDEFAPDLDAIKAWALTRRVCSIAVHEGAIWMYEAAESVRLEQPDDAREKPAEGPAGS